MLSPKRVKYRKRQRGTTDGVAHRGNTIAFGEFGLFALEPKWITNRQIEAARVAMTVTLSVVVKLRSGFSLIALPKKPAETRMGKGKLHQTVAWLLLRLVLSCLKWAA